MILGSARASRAGDRALAIANFFGVNSFTRVVRSPISGGAPK
jgi:hypothetical protein